MKPTHSVRLQLDKEEKNFRVLVMPYGELCSCEGRHFVCQVHSPDQEPPFSAKFSNWNPITLEMIDELPEGDFVSLPNFLRTLIN